MQRLGAAQCAYLCAAEDGRAAPPVMMCMSARACVCTRVQNSPLGCCFMSVSLQTREPGVVLCAQQAPRSKQAPVDSAAGSIEPLQSPRVHCKQYCLQLLFLFYPLPPKSTRSDLIASPHPVCLIPFSLGSSYGILLVPCSRSYYSIISRYFSL